MGRCCAKSRGGKVRLVGGERVQRPQSLRKSTHVVLHRKMSRARMCSCDMANMHALLQL